VDVRRGDVISVGGTLQNMRSQMENIKCEVDWVLTFLDEGLISIGFEDFNKLDKAEFATVKNSERRNSCLNPMFLSKAHY
jgi:hypothetical protein